MTDEKPDIELIAEQLNGVDDYQDKIDVRLTKLEDKFKALTKIIGGNIVDLPRISLDQYLEDLIK